ncbi:MAG: DsrE family protein [Gammaproteobacteria bacterium]|nr:DsrE family protein [Gammaproteobacteria bacterium]
MGFSAQGVRFSVCQDTLLGANINNYQTDLYGVSESDIVPGGVAETASLQQEGFAYLKP